MSVSATVTCRECSKEFLTLPSHIVRKHKMTIQEYKTKHVGADLVGSIVRAVASEKSKSWSRSAAMCTKISAARRGSIATKEAKQNMRNAQLKYWQTVSPEKKLEHAAVASKNVKQYWSNLSAAEKSKHLCNMLSASTNRPNSEEKLLMAVLEEMLPSEYKYTGDGEVWFGNRNPDFINCNGQKKVIELFGERWHAVTDVAAKTEHYAKYGQDCLVVWAKELKLKNRPALISKLQQFHGAKHRDMYSIACQAA